LNTQDQPTIPTVQEMETQDLPSIPKVDEMKTWDREKVLRWIEQRDPNLLKDDDLESFKKADIIGRVFLVYDAALFQSDGVSRGRSKVLEDLVKEVNERSKFIPWT